MKKFNILYFSSLAIYGIIFAVLQLHLTDFGSNAYILVIVVGIFTLYIIGLTVFRGYLKSKLTKDTWHIFLWVWVSTMILLKYLGQLSRFFYVIS